MNSKKGSVDVIIVVASINKLVNIKQFLPALKHNKYNCKILVVDEGDEVVRKKNNDFLHDLPHAFYGPREREGWFAQRFGSMHEAYSSVIPKRCHAESSFGFLLAYEEEPDFVIELDDDVFPCGSHNFVNQHASNLFNQDGLTVHSKNKWYNTMENLELNVDEDVFPRGHPYAQETRDQEYVWKDDAGKCVLNMGLWEGYPDLDASTIVHCSGLDGRGSIRSNDLKKSKVVLGRKTYAAICSMNTSFVPKIIPAFYQLYMNSMNINRFDDIWSGIFLKKIADGLGEKICLGRPLLYHDKRPRNIFKDLREELNGMELNEILWRVIDSLELEGRTYTESYNSLAEKMKKHFTNLDPQFKRFMMKQIEKMELWLKIVDKLR
jgi:hypothetical protein